MISINVCELQTGEPQTGEPQTGEPLAGEAREELKSERNELNESTALATHPSDEAGALNVEVKVREAS